MPIVPIATTHTATATDLLELDFACAHCGARARASVLTTSYGVAVGAPLAIGAEERGTEARARALEGLTREGAALAGLARCPKCRARDAKAVRSAWLSIAPLAAFLGFLVGAPLSIFGILFRIPPALLGSAIALPVAALYAWRKVHGRCAQADRLVDMTETDAKAAAID